MNTPKIQFEPLAAAGLLSDLEAARDDQWNRFMRAPHDSRAERDAQMMWELLVRASNAVRRSLNNQDEATA